MENPSCFPPIDSDQPQPWLMVSHGTELQNHSFYNISNGQYFETSVPEFCNKEVGPTSYGWLALFDLGKVPIDCCLFNPSSREKIKLPPIELDPNSDRHCCILSKPPDNPDCHVLILFSDGSILFCQIGADKFVRKPKLFEDSYFFSAATNFMGKIYALINKSGSRCIFEIELVCQEVIVKPLLNDEGQPCQSSLPFRQYYCDHLIESCGDLLLVHTIYERTLSGKVKYFRIFKINTLDGDVTELMDIEDRTIVITQNQSMPLATTIDNKLEGLQNNTIYYTWGSYIVQYDIKIRSKTLLKVKSNCFDVEGDPRICWVMF